MTSITIEIIDHVVFLFLVALGPWNGRRRFQILTRAVNAGDPNARKRLFRTILIEKWALTGVVAAAWIALSRSAESIGLIADFTPLPLAGFALAALAIGALLMYARSVTRSEQMRAKTREALTPIRAMMPNTATEKRWFDAVSVTAGISEELIFRGFLFAYLAALIPGIPAAVVVILAGLVFGLGHAYQGLAGIVKTGMIGVLFGALCWMTDSVLAPMLLHAAVDLTSGWVSWQVLDEAGLDDMAAPAAA